MNSQNAGKSANSEITKKVENSANFDEFANSEKYQMMRTEENSENSEMSANFESFVNSENSGNSAKFREVWGV